MADVFISYSRKDSAFVRRIHQALSKRGRDVWVDWEDIPLTANWWQAITAGIESADTFVFVMSPDSVASPICNFEIAHAMQHNKRIVPIVRCPVDEKAAFSELETLELNEGAQEILADRNLLLVAHQSWGALVRHNWVLFTDDAAFDETFDTFLDILAADLDYIKLHTRYLVRALEWDNHDQNPGYLLQGDDLQQAVDWLTTALRTTLKPEPTVLHNRYINISRHTHTRRLQRQQITSSQLRQNQWIRLAMGLVLFVSTSLIIVLGFILKQTSTQNEQLNSTIAAMAMDRRILGEIQLESYASSSETRDAMSAWYPAFGQVDGVQMALVPPGCKESGLEEVGQICVEDPFWIDQHEVFNEEFPGEDGEDAQINVEARDDFPRVRVSFAEAGSYCMQRGGRLPTEDEWAYSARGSAHRAVPTYYTWVGAEGMLSFVPMITVDFIDRAVKMGSTVEQNLSTYGSRDPVFLNPSEWTSTQDPADPSRRAVRGGKHMEDLIYVENSGVSGNFLLNVIKRTREATLMNDLGSLTERIYVNETTRSSLIGFRCVRDYDTVTAVTP